MSIDQKELKAYLQECERQFLAAHGETDFTPGVSLDDYKVYAEDYINGERYSSENTKKKNQVAIKKFIRFMDENGYQKINSQSLLAYRRSLVNYAPNTVSQYMKRLKGSFEWMVNMGLISENPMPVKMIRRETYDKAPAKLDIEDLYNILSPIRPKTVSRKNFARNRAMVLLTLGSALRESEVLALTPKDLHWGNSEDGYITVECGKGGKSRNAPFPASCQQAVREYIKFWRPSSATDSDPVFLQVADNGSFKPLSVSTFYSSIKSHIRVTTGRLDLTPHSLRHSAASFLVSNQMNVKELQAVLGHSSLLTTQRYAQLLYPNTAPTQHANVIFDDLCRGKR